MGKIHEEAIVILQLQRKGIRVNKGHIIVPFGIQVGNGTHGKLDFLVNYKNYTIMYEKEKTYAEKHSNHLSKFEKKFKKEERQNNLKQKYHAPR